MREYPGLFVLLIGQDFVNYWRTLGMAILYMCMQ